MKKIVEHNLFQPGLSPRVLVDQVRKLDGVCLTSISMRDAGQSDFKNRLRIFDLKSLAPHYNNMGLFSAECHGGARWHVGIMNRKENPFEEITLLRKLMPNVMLQTLIRETNLWGYRPYAPNVVKHVVANVDIDVWRCFSFLNDIRNMKVVAEIVMARGRLFEPAICFTQADWATNEYYVGVTRDIVNLCSGTGEIILCIKDMAGVGSPARISSLIDAIKQKYPDLVINYHRHTTDGMALPALMAAAKAGAKILDAQEDSLTRFYGHAPILSLQAGLEEQGISVHLNRTEAEAAVEKARGWIKQYDWAESPFRGFDHCVTKHRMPGGAFPSSFEQAEQGNFLHLMPEILTLMSYYNKIINYFDATPGSQITWTTCSGIVNRYMKKKGETGVKEVLELVRKFVEEKKQLFAEMEKKEQDELLELFSGVSSDFKNLLLGKYGRLPVGWPDEWVYRSTFGEDWDSAIKERGELSPLELSNDEKMDEQRKDLSAAIGREPDEEEFILYLMHPKDAIEYIRFRETYSEAPLVLPTDIWRKGLSGPGSKVDFDFWGKPCCIELVSIGGECDGYIHVLMKVNNKTQVYAVETGKSTKKPLRMAEKPGDIGSPINGNLWRIGNLERGALKAGDLVRKGEEVANIEAMKMENAVSSPFDGQIEEICANLNESVLERQLLLVIRPT